MPSRRIRFVVPVNNFIMFSKMYYWEIITFETFNNLKDEYHSPVSSCMLLWVSLLLQISLISGIRRCVLDITFFFTYFSRQKIPRIASSLIFNATCICLEDVFLLNPFISNFLNKRSFYAKKKTFCYCDNRCCENRIFLQYTLYMEFQPTFYLLI